MSMSPFTGDLESPGFRLSSQPAISAKEPAVSKATPRQTRSIWGRLAPTRDMMASSSGNEGPCSARSTVSSKPASAKTAAYLPYPGLFYLFEPAEDGHGPGARTSAACGQVVGPGKHRRRPRRLVGRHPGWLAPQPISPLTQQSLCEKTVSELTD